MRTAVMAAAVCLCVVGVVNGEDAIAAIRKPTDVPAQGLGRALTMLAQEFEFQVLYQTEIVVGKRSNSLSGAMTAQEALEKVLAGTGLTFRYLDEKTVTIVPLGTRTTESERAGSGLRIAQADQGSAAGVAAPGTQPGALDSMKLEEIVVTAQKREERLQDVPVPVTVLNGEVLTQTNETRLQDFYTKIPGLALTQGGTYRASTLSIRGITNGEGAAPVVAVVIDDVPYGSSVASRGQPDIDPGDLARVELLRGPQGTLYGASSLGGLLKFVTVEPSTTGVSGRFQAGTESIHNGDGLGYNIRGSVNIPLSETLAIRASAFSTEDPGYINNIKTGQDGVNRQTSEGGRASLLWRPSDVFSLKLNVLLQDADRRGSEASTVGPGFSDLQIRSIPNTYTLSTITRAYSAVLNAKIGLGELVSVTGYTIDSLKSFTDLTGNSDGFFDSLSREYNPAATGSVIPQRTNAPKFSQELRYSLPLGKHLTWLVGGFYSREKNYGIANYSAADASNGMLLGPSYITQDTYLKYVEYAAFSNITYDITDRLDIQLGGRFSKGTQDSTLVRGGQLDASGQLFASRFFDPLVVVTHSEDSPFTYLVTPRYRITPNMMAYARFASGYRAGGANSVCGATVPCQFDPETTKNYELGFKGDFLNKTVTIDTSVYRIDWTNIQVGLSQGPLGYTGNAGAARSDGLEFSLEVRPTQGLTLSGWVALDDAKFTAHLPPDPNQAVAEPGDRLPYGSRVSGSLSADQVFLLNGPLSAFAGVTARYVGDRLGLIQPQGVQRQDLPAYTQVDMRIGLKYESSTVTAFVNNLTDRRGVLTGGIENQYLFADPNTYTFIQPRTIGLNFSKSFE